MIEYANTPEDEIKMLHPEEQKTMEENIGIANKILSGDISAGDIFEKNVDSEREKEILGEGKTIIEEITRKELDEARKYFNELVTNETKALKAKVEIQEKTGWTDSELSAMLDVLRHGLGILFGSQISSPDENAPDPGGSMDFLFANISHDYGIEVAMKVAPLIAWYRKEVKNLFPGEEKADNLKDKSAGGDISEKEELV